MESDKIYNMDGLESDKIYNIDGLEIDKIYNIDCLEGMRMLPQGHKYCIVTDPPFNVG